VSRHLLHIFSPKATAPLIKYFMIVVFSRRFREMLSIAFRPIFVKASGCVAATIFAGENCWKHVELSHPAWARVVFGALLPVPFYFMDCWWLHQAVVFMP